MPVVHIHTFTPCTAQETALLLAGLRDALRVSFCISDDGLYLFLQEHPSHHCLFPPGDTPSIIAEVACFAGRSIAQKADFYRLAARAVSAAGQRGEDALFIINEHPISEWGLGGQPAKTALNLQ